MAEIVLPNPHTAQVKVLTERKRFNVVACGRRWGKTKLGGSIALQAAIDGLPVGWFAPTYKYLQDALGEIGGRLKDAGGAATFDAQNKRWSFRTGGAIEFWSTEPQFAGDTESVVARGRKYALAIYDEAAHARRLKADWTHAIRATLADYQGTAWFFSSPRGRDYFHQLYMRGQNGEPGWASWQMPTSANPHIAPTEIESAKADLPADAFEQEYLAQFLSNAANPFGVEAIHACIVDELSDEPVAWWGVDLAKSQDHTVAIGIDHDGHVCRFERWQSDWNSTTERLVSLIDGARALVDSTGVGDPIVEQLTRRCGAVTGYPFTSQSKQRLMEGLAYAIQNKRTMFPAGVLVNELESFAYEYRPSGVRYSAPDGLHDDCVCALALAVYGMMSVPQFDFRIVDTGGARPKAKIDPKETESNRFARELNDERMWSTVSER